MNRIGLQTFQVAVRIFYISNFTDLNARSGDTAIQDWDCSDYTYDGHQGHDSLIRSFREQALGVPVFAVLDGVVVGTHDGEPDMNTVWDENNQANYVLIDHGGGYIVWYFHFRTGSVAVSPGQTGDRRDADRLHRQQRVEQLAAPSLRDP